MMERAGETVRCYIVQFSDVIYRIFSTDAFQIHGTQRSNQSTYAIAAAYDTFIAGFDGAPGVCHIYLVRRDDIASIQSKVRLAI